MNGEQRPVCPTCGGPIAGQTPGILGIDIGGTGIKGAVVDTEKGTMLSDRFRIPTPHPALPEAVADVVAQLVRHFNWSGPFGCTFPAVVKDGVAYSAANVDQSWIGLDAQVLFHRKAGSPVIVLNDADAAGVAEMAFGAGKGQPGVVILVTFGTGIGSALFLDGVLVPNTELGHIAIRGKDAEERASDRVRLEKDWDWQTWAEHVDEYLGKLEALFSPDLLIIGGGVSKKSEHFLPLLHRKARVVPAQLLNEAGIVGAALTARALLVPEHLVHPGQPGKRA